MLVLGIAPAVFVVNMNASGCEITRTAMPSLLNTTCNSILNCRRS